MTDSYISSLTLCNLLSVLDSMSDTEHVQQSLHISHGFALCSPKIVAILNGAETVCNYV